MEKQVGGAENHSPEHEQQIFDLSNSPQTKNVLMKSSAIKYSNKPELPITESNSNKRKKHKHKHKHQGIESEIAQKEKKYETITKTAADDKSMQKELQANTQQTKNPVSALPVFYKKPFEYGWKRELIWRTSWETSKETVNVYYITPSGKKLRSRSEILPYLKGDLDVEHFSFAKEPLGVGTEFETIRNDKTPSMASVSAPTIAAATSLVNLERPFSKCKEPKGASPPRQKWTDKRATEVGKASVRTSSNSSKIDGRRTNDATPSNKSRSPGRSGEIKKHAVAKTSSMASVSAASLGDMEKPFSERKEPKGASPSRKKRTDKRATEVGKASVRTSSNSSKIDGRRTNDATPSNKSRSPGRSGEIKKHAVAKPSSMSAASLVNLEKPFSKCKEPKGASPPRQKWTDKRATEVSKASVRTSSNSSKIDGRRTNDATPSYKSRSPGRSGEIKKHAVAKPSSMVSVSAASLVDMENPFSKRKEPKGASPAPQKWTPSNKSSRPSRSGAIKKNAVDKPSSMASVSAPSLVNLGKPFLKRIEPKGPSPQAQKWTDTRATDVNKAPVLSWSISSSIDARKTNDTTPSNNSSSPVRSGAIKKHAKAANDRSLLDVGSLSLSNSECEYQLPQLQCVKCRTVFKTGFNPSDRGYRTIGEQNGREYTCNVCSSLEDPSTEKPLAVPTKSLTTPLFGNNCSQTIVVMKGKKYVMTSIAAPSLQHATEVSKASVRTSSNSSKIDGRRANDATPSNNSRSPGRSGEIKKHAVAKPSSMASVSAASLGDMENPFSERKEPKGASPPRQKRTDKRATEVGKASVRTSSNSSKIDGRRTNDATPSKNSRSPGRSGEIKKHVVAKLSSMASVSAASLGDMENPFSERKEPKGASPPREKRTDKRATEEGKASARTSSNSSKIDGRRTNDATPSKNSRSPGRSGEIKTHVVAKPSSMASVSAASLGDMENPFSERKEPKGDSPPRQKRTDKRANEVGKASVRTSSNSSKIDGRRTNDATPSNNSRSPGRSGEIKKHAVAKPSSMASVSAASLGDMENPFSERKEPKGASPPRQKRTDKRATEVGKASVRTSSNSSKIDGRRTNDATPSNNSRSPGRSGEIKKHAVAKPSSMALVSAASLGDMENPFSERKEPKGDSTPRQKRTDKRAAEVGKASVRTSSNSSKIDGRRTNDATPSNNSRSPGRSGEIKKHAVAKPSSMASVSAASLGDMENPFSERKEPKGDSTPRQKRTDKRATEVGKASVRTSSNSSKIDGRRTNDATPSNNSRSPGRSGEIKKHAVAKPSSMASVSAASLGDMENPFSERKEPKGDSTPRQKRTDKRATEVGKASVRTSSNSSKIDGRRTNDATPSNNSRSPGRSGEIKTHVVAKPSSMASVSAASLGDMENPFSERKEPKGDSPPRQKRTDKRANEVGKASVRTSSNSSKIDGRRTNDATPSNNSSSPSRSGEIKKYAVDKPSSMASVSAPSLVNLEKPFLKRIEPKGPSPQAQKWTDTRATDVNKAAVLSWSICSNINARRTNDATPSNKSGSPVRSGAIKKHAIAANDRSLSDVGRLSLSSIECEYQLPQLQCVKCRTVLKPGLNPSDRRYRTIGEQNGREYTCNVCSSLEEPSTEKPLAVSKQSLTTPPFGNNCSQTIVVIKGRKYVMTSIAAPSLEQVNIENDLTEIDKNVRKKKKILNLHGRY